MEAAEVLNGIGNTYQTSHGSYLDLDNIIYYDIKKRRRFLVRAPLLCGEKRGAALFLQKFIKKVKKIKKPLDMGAFLLYPIRAPV